MNIGATLCHLPSGALFVLSGRVGDWYCGYDTAGLWGRWPANECAAVAPLAEPKPEPEPAGGWYGEPRQRGDGEGW